MLRDYFLIRISFFYCFGSIFSLNILSQNFCVYIILKTGLALHGNKIALTKFSEKNFTSNEIIYFTMHTVVTYIFP